MFNLTPWRNKQNGGELARQRENNSISQLRDEFETMFNRFFEKWPVPFESSLGRDLFWGFDIEDRDNEIVVTAEAPGFDGSEFDIQLSGNVLTISAEKKQEGNKGKRGSGSRQERHYASFRRVATLPQGIKADKVEATFRNGVLEIHLPKSEEAKAKRIQIKT